MSRSDSPSGRCDAESRLEDAHLLMERTPEGPRTVNPQRPPRFQRALERVSDQDRRYFAAHPDRAEYARPYRLGESYPILPTDVSRVRVSQVMPGCRLRSPIIEGVAR